MELEKEIEGYKNELKRLKEEHKKHSAFTDRGNKEWCQGIENEIYMIRIEMMKRGCLFWFDDDIISLESSFDIIKDKIKNNIENKSNRIEIEEINDEEPKYMELKNVPMMDGEYLHGGLLGLNATVMEGKVSFTVSNLCVNNMCTFPNSTGEIYIDDKVLSMINNKLSFWFGKSTDSSCVNYRSKTWKFEYYKITIGINEHFQFQMDLERISTE